MKLTLHGDCSDLPSTASCSKGQNVEHSMHPSTATRLLLRPTSDTKLVGLSEDYFQHGHES